MVFGRASLTIPSTSIASSFATKAPCIYGIASAVLCQYYELPHNESNRWFIHGEVLHFRRGIAFSLYYQYTLHMLKNNRVFFGIIALFLTAALFPSDNEASKETEYRLLGINRSVPLFAEEAVSPQMNFEFTLLDVNGAADAEFFNRFLYDGRDAAQYAQAAIGSFTETYLETRETVSSQNPPAASCNWEYIEKMNFRKLKEQGMVIERELYLFTGGAHGIPGKKYYTLDLAEHKVLAIDDFFREPEGETLRSIVMEELRLYSGLKGEFIEDGLPLSQGIFYTDDPAVSGNFFITDEGLGLCWEPYEIAPYVFGSIEITIPWETIRPLLRHDAMEFLEKCGIYMFMLN
jgi:hypothetical protein